MSAPSGFSVLHHSLAEMNSKLYGELAMNLPTIASSDSSSDDGSSIDLVFSGHWDDDKTHDPTPPGIAAVEHPGGGHSPPAPKSLPPLTPGADQIAHSDVRHTIPALHKAISNGNVPKAGKGSRECVRKGLEPAVWAEQHTSCANLHAAPYVALDKEVSSSDIALVLSDDEKPAVPCRMPGDVSDNGDSDYEEGRTADGSADSTDSASEVSPPSIADSEPSSSSSEDDEEEEENGEESDGAVGDGALSMQGWLSGAAGRLAAGGKRTEHMPERIDDVLDKEAEAIVAAEAEAAFQAVLKQSDTEIVAEELKASGQEDMPLLNLEVNLLAGMDLDGLLQRLRANQALDNNLADDDSRPQLTWNLPPAESLFLSDDED